MAESNTKNVFISHIHENDAEVHGLKNLIHNAGMDVRNGSITLDKFNNATNENYIKREILAPRIRWASALIVLISHDTHTSDWVNWEIEYAISEGKRIVGVFAQGATDADIPEAMNQGADAVLVGWQGARVIDALEGKLTDWDRADTSEIAARPAVWRLERYEC